MIAVISVPLQILLAATVTLAALFDLRRRKIPNLVSGAAALAGFIVQFVMTGLPGLRTAALGFGLGFLLYFPLWLLHARGAGDVKLLAATGAILGPGNLFVLFLLAAILGGVIALVLVLLKNRVGETARNVAGILADLVRLRRPASTLAQPGAITLPHAVVLALGSFCILAIMRRI